MCDYSDAYILVSGTITITGAGADDAAKRLDERNKEVIFKNCATFIDCISKINNTEIDNAKYLDVVMQMYNLIEYSDNFSKTSESLRQYYRDNPNDNITQSESFQFKLKIIRKTPATGNTKDVKIAVPLKYLSNFWRTLEMLFINYEISLVLTWFKNCVIPSGNEKTNFATTDTKLYVPIIPLLTQDNAKILEQLRSGFKRKISWNKYQSKVLTGRKKNI